MVATPPKLRRSTSSFSLPSSRSGKLAVRVLAESKFVKEADPSAINAIKAILDCPDVSSQILQLMASLALEKAGDTVVQHAVRGMMEFLVMAGDEGLRKAVLPVSR